MWNNKKLSEEEAKGRDESQGEQFSLHGRDELLTEEARDHSVRERSQSLQISTGSSAGHVPLVVCPHSSARTHLRAI